MLQLANDMAGIAAFLLSPAVDVRRIASRRSAVRGHCCETAMAWARCLWLAKPPLGRYSPAMGFCDSCIAPREGDVCDGLSEPKHRPGLIASNRSDSRRLCPVEDGCGKAANELAYATHARARDGFPRRRPVRRRNRVPAIWSC